MLLKCCNSVKGVYRPTLRVFRSDIVKNVKCHIPIWSNYALHVSRVRGRGKSLTRTPLRIGVDIVKNIVEKHGCFVLVVN